MERVQTFARSGSGRIAIAAAGLCIVGLVLYHADPSLVWASLARAAAIIPAVFMLEGLYNVCELLALRELYGEDKHKLPATELARAGLVAFALGGVMPLGRPIVESVRGIAFARWTSGARAAAAGTKLQYLLLVSQAALCIPCAIAAYMCDAPLVLVLASIGNAALTFGMGMGLHVAGRRGAIGAGLGKLGRRAGELAPALDRHLRDEGLPASATLYVIAGRAVQVFQYCLLLIPFVGRFDVVRGFAIVGVQMVGTTLGDLLPAQLGGTEAVAPLGAATLSLSLADALAIPLLVHLVQAAWIALGFVAYAAWKPKVLGVNAAATP
jgi:hypothetical protein